MAIGKNTKLNTKSKKGGKKKIIDPFARKDWFDVKAPKMFQVRQVGKTLGTRSAGTRDVKDSLRGRVFTASLGDLKNNGEDDAFRKFHLKCEDIQGKNVLTNFYGMELTRDKLCSLVRKWQSLIECHTDVKTADGYTLRLFLIGFTRKRQNQLRKTSYAQSAQARAIRKKMVEVCQRECTNVDLPQLVEKLIPEVIGKEIEKLCQGIYPLQNVFVRQVKTLRAPKLDVSRLLELHGGAAEVAGFGQEIERLDDGKEAEVAADAAVDA